MLCNAKYSLILLSILYMDLPRVEAVIGANLQQTTPKIAQAPKRIHSVGMAPFERVRGSRATTAAISEAGAVAMKIVDRPPGTRKSPKLWGATRRLRNVPKQHATYTSAKLIAPMLTTGRRMLRPKKIQTTHTRDATSTALPGVPKRGCMDPSAAGTDPSRASASSKRDAQSVQAFHVARIPVVIPRRTIVVTTGDLNVACIARTAGSSPETINSRGPAIAEAIMTRQ